MCVTLSDICWQRATSLLRPTRQPDAQNDKLNFAHALGQMLEIHKILTVLDFRRRFLYRSNACACPIENA